MNKYYKKVFTIPNILSLFRIFLIPFIVWVFFLGKYYTCASLIVLSAITDVVDGFIARKFNMVSEIGKALDPISDKLTLLAILFCLSLKTPLIFILFLVFIVKELIMCVEGILIVKFTGTTYSAKWYGKLSTLVLYLTAIFMVAYRNMNAILTQTLFYSCLFVLILSFTLYTIYNLKKIRNSRNLKWAKKKKI